MYRYFFQEHRKQRVRQSRAPPFKYLSAEKWGCLKQEPSSFQCLPKDANLRMVPDGQAPPQRRKSKSLREWSKITLKSEPNRGCGLSLFVRSEDRFRTNSVRFRITLEALLVLVRRKKRQIHASWCQSTAGGARTNKLRAVCRLVSAGGIDARERASGAPVAGGSSCG